MFHILGGLASLFVTPKVAEQTLDVSQSEVVDLDDYPETDVIDLILYPCRGVTGIHVKEITAEKSGFKFDREWFLVRKDLDKDEYKGPGNQWVAITRSQDLGRTTCKFVDKEVDGIIVKYLVFSHPNQAEDLWIDTTKPATEDTYYIYNFENMKIPALSEGDEAAEWFSQVTGLEVRLTRGLDLAKSSTHDVDFGFKLENEDTRRAGHCDAAYHMISQKSVDRLQTLVSDPDLKVTAEAFRPNIVIAGVEPDIEDNIREMVLTSTSTAFRVVKLCVRCKTPTLDKITGKFHPGGEPYTTLRKYKTHEDLGVIFGNFLQPSAETVIKVGDKFKFTKILKTPLVFNNKL